ncbi:MAG: hypothetical protein GY861_09320 [bacterium]|nr:hypothetical protein [bacterium]
MDLNEKQEGIRAYFDKGYEYHYDPLESYIECPSGLLCSCRLLVYNICNICEEAEERGCEGWHDEKLIHEEQEARNLSRLIHSLPLPHTQYLPEIT